MKMTFYTFSTPNVTEQCFAIRTKAELTANVTDDIRVIIEGCLNGAHKKIYLDLTAAEQVDLSGINEVIHSYYTLRQVSKELILVYLKNSPVAEWVATTGLDQFMSTAITI